MKLLGALALAISLGWGGLFSQTLEVAFTGDISQESLQELTQELRNTPSIYNHRISAVRGHLWLAHLPGMAPSERWCEKLLFQHGLEPLCYFSDEHSPASEEADFRACLESAGQSNKAASFNTCATPLAICDGQVLPVTPWGLGTMILFAPDPPRNPLYDSFTSPSPWTNPWNGGSNFGCLQSGELNTIWLRIEVTSPGDLEWAFVFPDFDGFDFIYMDWSMFNLTPTMCTDIALNTAASAPVRCNWNDLPETPTAATGMSRLATSIPIANEEDNFEVSMTVASGQEFLLLMDNWSGGTFNGTFDFSLSSTSAQVCGTILNQGDLVLSAESSDHGVNLGWMSIGQTIFEEFVLERSVGDSDFAALQEFGVEGMDGNHAYRDFQPLPGTNRYRIKGRLANGESVFSNVVEVAWKGEGFGIYPMPATHTASHLYLNEPAQHLSIYSVTGQLLYAQDLDPQNTAPIELPRNWETGVYSVVVQMENGARFSKMYILH